MRPARREKVFGAGRAVPLDRNAKARIAAYARAWSARNRQAGHRQSSPSAPDLDRLASPRPRPVRNSTPHTACGFYSVMARTPTRRHRMQIEVAEWVRAQPPTLCSSPRNIEQGMPERQRVGGER
jgi:hypothetical protein